MKLTYHRCGDYLLPDLGLDERDKQPIGKYGMLRMDYLKNHRPILYNQLLLSGELIPHLAAAIPTPPAMVSWERRCP